MARSTYLIPPYGSPGKDVHAFLLEAVSEGQAWLKAQRPTVEWERIKDALGPTDPAMDLEGESNVGYNKTNRTFRDLVASLTNFKYEGEYKADHDDQLFAQAHLLSKRDRAWFKDTAAQARIREFLQYGTALGTGYLYQDWDKEFHGPRRGDVRLQALDPADVTFVQLPRDGDFQKAYMVLLRFELPINLARKLYSYNAAFAESLQPDRDTPNWLIKGLRKVQELMGVGSPVLRLNADREQRGSFPTVDIYHAYTMDSSINTSGQPVTMGVPGTNWAYTVPSLGTPISSENPRIAEADDALLFPLRRLTIFSTSVPFPAYDNSSPFWHGKVPIVRCKFNDKAWEALGQSLLGDVKTLQTSMENIMRDIEDSAHARLDPPIGFDEQLVDKTFAEAVNPRRGGVRVAMPLQAGKVFQILGEQWQYEVPSWVLEFLKEQDQRADYLSGVPDLVAIAKAKQVPSADSMEKILEMAGPLVQDMIRAVEEPFQQLGEMRKALFLQYDTRARLLQLFGEAGIVEENVKYAPDLIVPLIKGEPHDQYRERTKRYIHEFRYHLTQTGVNEIHRMVTKLAYLQLAKVMPIDWWTLAKVWQIPNFAATPKNPKTGQEASSVLEHWIVQEHIKREMAEEMAEGQAAAGGKAGPGRPHTNAKPPSIASKDGGTRSTIKTS